MKKKRKRIRIKRKKHVGESQRATTKQIPQSQWPPNSIPSKDKPGWKCQTCKAKRRGCLPTGRCKDFNKYLKVEE